MNIDKGQGDAILGGFVLIALTLVLLAGLAGVVQLWMWVLQ